VDRRGRLSSIGTCYNARILNRVAITGIGVVAPGAIGIDAFRALLASGKSAIACVERFDTSGLSAHKAALVRDFKPRDFIAPLRMRRMNNLSRFAVSAARLALDDVAPAPSPADRRRSGGATLPAETGVAVGSAFGPVQTSVDYMREYVEKGAALAPPQLFAESVANAPGSHVAIEWGFRGFNVTVTQRESSALAAAMYGASQVLKGSVRAAMIGGVEETTEMLFSVLDRIGALDDRQRNGMAIGEGSAMLVAEAIEPARYGFLSGFGIARDVTASMSDWGDDPNAIVTAMRAAIDDAELTVNDIDAIYASANGAKRGDHVECLAIRQLFGDIPLVATKGYFGEYAAAGALQLVAALIALDEQTLHASCGFESEHFVRERRAMPLRNILVNSVSAGGGIVCAVVSR
jgi:3-oxoacyl-[acyl-carrier-protein] synthase II